MLNNFILTLTGSAISSFVVWCILVTIDITIPFPPVATLVTVAFFVIVAVTEGNTKGSNNSIHNH